MPQIPINWANKLKKQKKSTEYGGKFTKEIDNAIK